MSDSQPEGEELTDRIELVERANHVELDIEGMADVFSISIDFFNGQPQLVVDKPGPGVVSESSGIREDGHFYVSHREPGSEGMEGTETLSLRLGEPETGDSDEGTGE